MTTDTDGGSAGSGSGGDGGSGNIHVSVKGYQWAGYETYNNSVQIDIEDDDDKMDWFGQEVGEKAHISLDGGSDEFEVEGGGMLETVFVTEDGEEVTEDILFTYSGDTGWVFMPQNDSKFTEGAKITGIVKWTETDGVDYSEIVCFTPSSMILTRDGEIPAGHLRAGMKVVTADSGFQTIRWVGRSPVLPVRRMLDDLHPVLIRAGALGDGVPNRDLMVSPQHRLCLKGADISLLFALSEAFVPALGLLDEHRVLRPRDASPLTYVHILLDRHEVIFSNGLASESFRPTPRVLARMDPLARRELTGLYPDILHDTARWPLARPCLSVREAGLLRLRPWVKA
jgi:Hint domain-containing protein